MQNQPRKNWSDHLKIISVIIWQGNLEVNPSVLIGSFLVEILQCGPFGHKLCIFHFKNPAYSKFVISMECYNIINYLTGEYWPSVICVQTMLYSVRTAPTSVLYSSVWPLCSVSKRLIYFQVPLVILCWNVNQLKEHGR